MGGCDEKKPDWIVLSVTLALGCVIRHAAPQAPAVVAPAAPSIWTVLGTNAGPLERPDRFEPAPLLTLGAQKVLIDCGDGAGQQLASVGVSVCSRPGHPLTKTPVRAGNKFSIRTLLVSDIR